MPSTCLNEPPQTLPSYSSEPDGFSDAVYIKALQEVKGLGNIGIQALLDEAGTPRQLWEADEAFLNARLKPDKRAAFLNRRELGLNPHWLAQYQDLGIQVLAKTDEAYPALLREIHDAPLLLYVQGNPNGLQGKTLGVVGTRNASEYGRQVTDMLVRELKPAQPTIVSGLAAGIDTFAHWAAIREGLRTVAVFGCGLDIISPSANQRLAREIVAQGGALVSEYPLGLPPSKTTFPKRNRIVAGLSQGLLVIEGDIRSGALITARLAVEEGRSVFAVPGNLFSAGSQGPHYLIKHGAIPVTTGDDILSDLPGWQVSSKGSTSEAGFSAEKPLNSAILPILDEDETRVLMAISQAGVAIEDLSAATGFPSAKINELLTMLELEGLIVLLPGAKVCHR